MIIYLINTLIIYEKTFSDSDSNSRSKKKRHSRSEKKQKSLSPLSKRMALMTEPGSTNDMNNSGYPFSSTYSHPQTSSDLPIDEYELKVPFKICL